MVRYLILVLFVALLSVLSCADREFCGSEGRRFVQVGFYNGDDSLRPVIIDSIRLSGSDSVLGRDSSIFFQLPLNAWNDSTEYRIYWRPVSDSILTRLDLLTLYYTANTSIVSPDCGVNRVLTLEGALTSFDSLQFFTQSLNEQFNEVDIKLFFHLP